MTNEILLPIYKKIPDALIPVFEFCWKKENKYSRRKRVETLEFASILGLRKDAKEVIDARPETYYLHQLNRLDRKVKNEVLRNPLVRKFIKMKFKLVRPFLVGAIIFQVN